ncbi:hypothetical protein [Streptomyces sp. NPDC051776]|uniref:hypothetical protein n=1 Tax=Streptomyces sp. NPDC051776 TaxID=3155414 RepID=UPI0034262A29
MTTDETSRFVRLRVELVLEVTSADHLTTAALDHIDSDTYMPQEERMHARAAVGEDEAEALAYLVDPFRVVEGIAGIELAQASWSSERIAYDPSSAEWDLGLDDDEDGEERDEDAGEAGPGGVPGREGNGDRRGV